ncbi:flagellar basal body P-ring formation chaperone FlgA [Hyphomicrobium sp. LHD-15]|uniref:flagellar basal body P-ring formation chaperone FlgA n=1 Tax=Hyphomicrobium sp. LHD-15 TaxID=3072142 RepID=UPI00280CC321|nr:flagellar basal body P-ring formation chaperone FlgA [Hyphomicrobium sp. LHD-15]MDQ8699084.1 flagellar basal body P-ring formation chaperone FlgA [Hyphomicrobium sp. LHD-15]
MAEAIRSVYRRFAAMTGTALVAAGVLAASLGSSAVAADFVLPVPRVTIYPGDAINDAMLIEQEFRGADVKGYAVSRDMLVGKVSRQTLLPNRPIAQTAIREPFAIKQGEPAVVVFISGGLVISGTAIPLQAGAAGEIISLRNTESGTTIRGKVQADGTVRVGMQ